ncbi:MAG TPA: hypothetical protein EYH53_01945 [Methanothermococcus okinawensis]|nr:hypothetical protein [Methanothermococcus okinawensis]
MGIKYLGFEEIKKRAENFRNIVEKYSPTQDFNIDPEEKKFLEQNSLAPIIATICNQQITAEDAWRFPYWLNTQLNKKELSAEVIYQMGKDKVKDMLQHYMEDKWPSSMTEEDRKEYLERISSYIIKTCKIIIDKYGNNPDNMFKKGRYIAPEIYFILRVLPGIGPKKASMITKDFVKAEGVWYRGLKKRLKKQGINFEVERKNLCDVPVDVHVVKVYGRMMGEFKKIPTEKKFLNYWPDIQNFAKLTFPDFPGKIDEVLWTVGRDYCDENQPKCRDCPLRDVPCEYAKRREK